MKQVASRQNPIVSRFRAAAQNDDRTLVLLDGPHLVGEAIAAGLSIEEAAIGSGDMATAEISRLVALLEQRGVDVTEATSAVMSALSPVRSTSAIVALGRRPPDAGARVFDDANALVAIACGVQDPGNVGAIVRVAEAAGATGFIAAGQTADPFTWKAMRGSMGSALRLPIAQGADPYAAVADARAHGCRIVAAVPRGGTPLFEAQLDGPLAVVVGSEGQGLPGGIGDTADIRLTIPMAAAVESLNTAVSAALLLYEAMRQRR